MRDKIKVTHRKIYDYWQTRIDESDMGTDWDEGLTRCWRCGDEHTKLQRCHIIADAIGGKADHPSNFVLLCGKCHRESPNVNNPQTIWDWIKATRKPCYGQFWGDRISEEFKKLFGRLPKMPVTAIEFLDYLKNKNISQENFSLEDLKDLHPVFRKFIELHEKVTYHFGGESSNSLAFTMKEAGF